MKDLGGTEKVMEPKEKPLLSLPISDLAAWKGLCKTVAGSVVLTEPVTSKEVRPAKSL